MNESGWLFVGCWLVLPLLALALFGLLSVHQRLKAVERRLDDVQKWLPSLHEAVGSLWAERRAGGGEVAGIATPPAPDTGVAGAEPPASPPSDQLTAGAHPPAAPAAPGAPEAPDAAAPPASVAEATAEAPTARAPSPPETPASAPATAEPPSRDPAIAWWENLEENLGARLPVWLGAVALALAGAFLVKYSVEQGWLGPPVRVGLAVAFGLALEAIAFPLRRSADRVAAGLAAAGIAVLYMAFLGAVHLYGLIPVAAGFALMVVTTAAAVALSLVHGPIIAVVGMAGGFLAPYWLFAARPQPRLLFFYLLLIHLGVVAVARRRSWFLLPMLSLAACLVWGMYFVFDLGAPERAWLTTYLLLALGAWLVPLAADWGSWSDEEAWKDGTARVAAVAAVAVTLGLVGGVAFLGSMPTGTVLFFLVPVAAGMIALARLRPPLELLPWVAAVTVVCQLLNWGMSWRLTGAAATGGPAFPGGWVLAVHLGFFVALVGGGLLAIRGAVAPGRWAAFAAFAGLLLYGAARVWPDSLAPWASLGADGLALAGAVLFALAAHFWGTPLAATDPEAAGRAAFGAPWGHAATVRPILATAAVVFALFAAGEGLEGWGRVLALAAGVAATAWLGSRAEARDLRLLPVFFTAMALWSLAAVGLPAAGETAPALAGLLVAVQGLALWAALRWGARWMAAAENRSEAPGGLSQPTWYQPVSVLLRAASVLALAFVLRHLVVLALRSGLEWGAFARSAVLPLALALLAIAFLAAAVRGARWAGPVEAVCALALLAWGWLSFLLQPGLDRNPGWISLPVGSTPVFNHLLWVYGGGAVVFAVGAHQAVRWLGERRRTVARVVDWLGGVTAVALLFLLVTLEVRQAFRGSYLDAASRAPLAESWATSVAWLLLGLSLLLAGLLRHSRFLRAAALVVIGIAAVKVFLFDVARLGDLYRVLSFLGLGGTLLLLAWLYQRFVFRRAAALWLTMVLGAGLWAGCGDEPADGPPLWTAEMVPEVLVEAGRLQVPAGSSPLEAAPNRFLAGWVPWIHQKRPVMGAGRDGARLQVVHLAHRPRTLHLDLVGEPGTGDGRVAVGDGVGVRVSPVGRPNSWTTLDDVEWGDPTEITLPADLPFGRLLVELVRSPGSSLLDLAGAGIRPSLPAGEARFEGGDLVQTGWSRVEAVRRVGPGEAVVGTFHPPDDAADGQVFRATVEDSLGEILTTFEWREGQPGWKRTVRLPTGDAEATVRLAFSAEGDGPPGTWSDLRWRDPRPEEPFWVLDGAGEPATGDRSRPSGDGVADGAGEEASARPPRLVMVYVMDALRADHAGEASADGPLRTTPFDLRRHPEATATVDRLAAEGRVYTAHRSVAPSTLPSTRAFFSGRLQPEARDAGEAVLLAERFRRAGYRTALVSGNPYVGPAYGLDRGFDHVAEDVVFDPESAAPFNDNAARVHAAALEWLQGLGPDEKAFVYLHTIHPHNPYDPPPELAAAFTRGLRSRIDGSTDTLFAVQRRRRAVDDADRARLAALYAGAFAYNDRELGRFLDGVAARVEPRDTLLALTSDHGEELFDHGGVLHGYTLYEEQLRVPLILWAPGWSRPLRSDAPTTTLDLRATLLGLLPDAERRAGLRETEGAVRDLLGPRAVPRPRMLHAAAPNVRDGLVSLRFGDSKLVFAPGSVRNWGMGLGLGRSRDPEYFFDLSRDPRERRNRAGLGGIEEDWLRSRLRAWTTARRPTTRSATPTDPETRKRLEALGYLR